jgi:hypothetical protein
LHKPEKCDEGFVRLSDGTCAQITADTIRRLEKMVQDQKAVLDATQAAFNLVAKVNCTSCPGAKEYFELRPKLQHDHEVYLAVLKMFLGALLLYESKIKAKEEKFEETDEEKEDLRGAEFVPGVRKLRPHCEPWTALNASTLGFPSKNFCAIICRSQPSCVGFGWDPESEWCLWYDDAKPQSEDTCGAGTKTEYVKNWQGHINENLWIAINKVHIFDEAMQKSLEVARLQAEQAGHFFDAWDKESKEEDANATLMDIHKENLTSTANFYGGTLHDANEIKKQLTILRNSAYALTRTEVSKRPAFGKSKPPPTPKPKKVEIKMPVGLEEPLSDPPKILQWHDFPNSQDTAWSQQHPDCPMGTPCFCDCKCRGAPPQNFVEPPPPPYPPPPCPPPPIPPPPGMLSAIAQALCLV